VCRDRPVLRQMSQLTYSDSISVWSILTVIILSTLRYCKWSLKRICSLQHQYLVTLEISELAKQPSYAQQYCTPWN
jgi:hypothetical protein